MKNFFQHSTYSKGLLLHFLVTLGYTCLFLFFYFHYLPEAESPGHFNSQLFLSRILVTVMFCHLLLVVIIRRRQTSQLLKEFIFGTGSPYTLAVVRFFIMFLMLNMYIGWAIPELYVWAELPTSERQSLPFMGWFIENIPISPQLYYYASITGAICSLFGMFGLFTRVVLLLHIPIAIYVFGVPNFFGKTFHHQIFVWFPALLAFSKCADVLSIDSFLKKKFGNGQHDISPKMDYALPLKFIWMLYALIYFFSGFKKLWLSGLDWALTDSVINQMQLQWVEFYDRVPSFRIDYYPHLAKAGGLGVLFFELFYPLLILSSTTRLITLAGGLSFHKLTDYFLYISFSDLQQTYVSYVNWDYLNSIRKKITGQIFKAGFVLIVIVIAAYLFAIEMLMAIFSPSEIIAGLILIFLIFFWIKKRKEFKWNLGLKNFKSFISNLSIPNSTSPQTAPSSSGNKTIMVVGFTLVIINGLFGLFSVNSWPFSAYPTYSSLVGNKIEMLHLEAFDNTGKQTQVQELGKNAEFRKEDILPFEKEIITAYRTGDTLDAINKSKNYWKLWELYVPELKNVDSINIYIATSSIVPEWRNEIISREFLFAINTGD